MAEQWLPVPGWPGYQVSDLGRVRSVDRVLANGQFCGGKVLRQSRDRKGYRVVHLRAGGRSAVAPVHVLAAAAFIGPRPAGMHILHAGDDRDRNDLSLRYGTPAENVSERTKRTRRRKGRKGKKTATGETGRKPYRAKPAAAGAERR